MSAILAYSDPASADIRIPSRAVDRIEQWARKKPDAIALLHKRGEWRGHTWEDVWRRLADLRGALAHNGIADGARFAVSGAIDPQLVLLVLAADANGARIIPVDRYADGAALRGLLSDAAATHAYVPDRKALSLWLASGYINRRPVPLFSGQAVARGNSSWSILPLPHAIAAASAGERNRAGARRSNRKLNQLDALWVDEGTEWFDGLTEVIEAWLENGNALAAPETTASSSRDRREVQPVRIVASAARQRRLRAELDARLYRVGTLHRALAEYSLRAANNPFSSWIGRRIAKLHGLPLDVVRNSRTPRETAHHAAAVGNAT